MTILNDTVLESNKYLKINFNGGDLLKIQLRDGTDYSSTGIEDFIQPLLDEFQNDYSDIPLLLRGDSGFTKPEFYEQQQRMILSHTLSSMENTCIRLAHGYIRVGLYAK